MEKICNSIVKKLTSFEQAELEKFLETVEQHEYYASGYGMINGGFASTKVTDLIGDYDEDTDEEYDSIEFELESGVQDMGSGGTSDWSKHLISLRVINNQEMTIKEKMAEIQEA